MASVKSTMIGILVVLVLAVIAAGGAFGYQRWQVYRMQNELKTVEDYLNKQQPQEAEKLLAQRLESARPSTPWAPQALTLRFRALEMMKDKPGSLKLAQQVLNEKKPWVKPGQEAWARAKMVVGQTAIDEKQKDAAQTHFDQILAQPAGSWGLDEAQVGMARLEMAKGQVNEAQKRLEDLLTKYEDKSYQEAPVKFEIENLLGILNMALVMHPAIQPEKGDQEYIIQKGDTLDRIRKKLKVSPDLVMGINQISDPKKLTIGRRLKIPNLELSIVVDISDNTLTLSNHGKFFKRYKVRTAAVSGKTPTGKYRVENKMIDPPWRDPRTGQSYGSGDPNNELGCRWLGFVGNNIGIHEARDPNTVGTYSSNGCVGMRQADVIELYNLVPKDTPVEIKGAMNPEAAAPIIATTPNA